MLLFLLACGSSTITLDDTGELTLIEADADTDVDSDTDTDRPCAFIDNWIPEMQLPNMTLYRYDLTGCGVVQGCTCDDNSIADAGLEAAAFLDGSQGAVTLNVHAWVPGSTSCTCTVEDYDYHDEYTASYTVAVESTE